MTTSRKEIAINLSKLERRAERCCCFRGLDTTGYDSRIIRYYTKPHIRGASLYDGERLLAVGELMAVESAADRLNGGATDVEQVLRRAGLIG